MDEHAQKYNLLGIRMKVAILKADYLNMRGDMASARNTLEEALGILDSPSVQSISSEIQERLRNID